MEQKQDRIEFWKDLWVDIITNFHKKPAFGFTLYNPHILIEDIIIEIVDNSFKNTDNKSFFYAQLNYYLENDIVVEKYFKAKFAIARRNFEPNKAKFLLEILKDLKKSFTDGMYFSKCIDELAKLLIEEGNISKEFIDQCSYLSQSIIIEYMKKQYVLDDIIKFPDYIFENYDYDNNRLVTKFPHGMNFQDYLNEDGEIKDVFFETIKENIDNLTIMDRLHSLHNIFNKKTYKANYIFVIEGLKGSISIDVAGVTFYSLDNKRFTEKSQDEFDEEDLQSNSKNSVKFVQAAVEVDFLSTKSSLIDAISKLENALDLVSCYFNTKTPLEIDTSKYLVVQDGKWLHWNSGTDKRLVFHKHIDSLNTDLFKDSFDTLIEKDFLWKNVVDSTALKIRNAIHWHRKAQESKKDEDKLLNYWISIENLFSGNDLHEILNKNTSKFNVIQELISSNQMFSFLYSYGWDLYWHYNKKVSKIIPSQTELFSDELIEKANFNRKTGEKIYLKKFISCLEEIQTYEKNKFYIDQLDNVKRFYSDSSYSKKILENHIEQIRNDLLMIYRLRNLIVHNAHYDNTLLKYYVRKIKDFSNDFIRAVIRDTKQGTDLNEVIFKIHLKKEYYLTDLQNGKLEVFE